MPLPAAILKPTANFNFLATELKMWGWGKKLWYEVDKPEEFRDLTKMAEDDQQTSFKNVIRGNKRGYIPYFVYR